MAAALKENRTLTTLYVGSEYGRHEVVAVACVVHWWLYKQHVVLVSQGITLVLTHGGCIGMRCALAVV